ncbi:unnamed protein product [Lactuca virosa]|uniref:Transmembrane 9 superfamily member n=1 Tax=Lactuca virosa TaxID=75947 RepID=A0AAU9N029_9ASTR|nr:unnamed protein product [Lactuca virosa]
MVQLRKYPFLILLLIYLGIQVELDASDHRYSEGDVVPFYANKIGPISNSWEIYAYYELPYCSQDDVKEKKLNLGEMLNGDHLVSTPYKLEFLVDKDFEVLCNKTLRSRKDITEDKEVDVSFTYSVKWTVTQQSVDRRMEKYIGSAFLPHHITIHHHSVTFSSVILLILIISLLTFYLLVLREDISKNSVDVEEDQVISNQEEIGWKNVHGDVFRFPQHKSLFAAALGVGSQLFILIIAILALGLLGFFQPYIRGVVWNALIIVYALTSLDTSVSFYCQLEGTNWMKNLILTGGLYLGPLFLTFTFLDIVAIFYGSTTALPLRAIVMLSLSWIFIASPLLLIGSIIGKTRMSEFQAPCKTAKIPREVPPLLRWYKGVLPQMALAGILPFSVINIQLYYIFESVWGHSIYILYSIMSIVFFLLLIMTALVSVALTYFQLAVEDHQWWWRSFLCGGSTGLYIYVYCIYYYFKRSEMNGFMQISFYFGYMACVCFGIFLVLGSTNSLAYSTYVDDKIHHLIKERTFLRSQFPGSDVIIAPFLSSSC